MFTKGSDWNKTPAYGTGGSVQLPKGGYVCVIKNVKGEKSSNGRDMMAIAFDIAEGEQQGFYEKQYTTRKQNNADTKWGGVYRQCTTEAAGNTNPFFKGLITVIEKSNNFTLPDSFGEKDLQGKLFGAIFGREEVETSDGKKVWTTKITSVRSVDVIRSGDYEVPEDKPLSARINSGKESLYTVVTDDDDLPF